MSNQKLKELLERLNVELESVDDADEVNLSMLRGLGKDIEELLANTDAELPDLSLVERLDEAVRKFEVTYPTLTAMLSEMSKILSNAGI